MGGKTLHSVQCPDCQAWRNVNGRRASDIRLGLSSARCRQCAYELRHAGLATGARYRSYWLKPAYETDGRQIHAGFTKAEIADMAAGLELLLEDGSRYAKPRDGRTRHQTYEAVR